MVFSFAGEIFPQTVSIFYQSSMDFDIVSGLVNVLQ